MLMVGRGRRGNGRETGGGGCAWRWGEVPLCAELIEGKRGTRTRTGDKIEVLVTESAMGRVWYQAKIVFVTSAAAITSSWSIDN